MGSVPVTEARSGYFQKCAAMERTQVLVSEPLCHCVKFSKIVSEKKIRSVPGPGTKQIKCKQQQKTSANLGHL